MGGKDSSRMSWFLKGKNSGRSFFCCLWLTWRCFGPSQSENGRSAWKRVLPTRLTGELAFALLRALPLVGLSALAENSGDFLFLFGIAFSLLGVFAPLPLCVNTLFCYPFSHCWPARKLLNSG